MPKYDYKTLVVLFGLVCGCPAAHGQYAAPAMMPRHMMPRHAYEKLGEFKPGFYGKPSSDRGEGLQSLPYRTLAVDPTRILLGSVLFVPQAFGITLPSGEMHDGFFFAQEARRAAGDSLIVYVGEELPGDNAFIRSPTFRRTPLCEVYVVREPVSGAFRHRYQSVFGPKPKTALHAMLAKDVNALLREVSTTEQDLISRLTIYSERAKGTPYALFCLGEGPAAKYDRDPLIDFSRADCVTFVEQTLALSLASNYEQMFANLLRIRYKDGEIGFLTRNHYTHADWIPNNAWLLEDITSEIGGGFCEDMAKVIDRAGFFRKLGVPEAELQNVPGPQNMTIKYVPTRNLPKITEKLKGGEIVSIVQKMPGIFSAHMGFIIRDAYGNVLFRHASSREEANQVTDEFFNDVIAQLRASNSRVGMAFIRIKANVK